MKLTLRTCEVRSWRSDDLDSRVLHAGNANVLMNLHDRFPFTRRAARTFIRAAQRARPETAFAIAVEGRAVGGISVVLGTDIERVTGTIGYWLGEPFWGRGIATEALIAMTGYAIETYGLTRVVAVAFAANVASCRVLEKAGYRLETRLCRSAVKDGAVIDQLQYAFVAPIGVVRPAPEPLQHSTLPARSWILLSRAARKLVPGRNLSRS